MAIVIGIAVPLSKTLTESILLATGNIVWRQRVVFDLTDEAAKPYRRHFVAFFLANPSCTSKQFEYSLDEPTDLPLGQINPGSIYDLWKSAMKARILVRLSEYGSVSNSDYSYLDGILTQSEQETATEIYNKTIQDRADRRKKEEEENRLKFEADREALRQREEAEAKVKAEAEHNPTEWIMPLSTFSGITVSTENPLKWRTKNWIAIVTRNPKKPAGLERIFMDKSKLPGSFYIIPDNILKPGMCLEFGSVDIDKRGRESKFYRSMVVKEVCQDKVILAHCLNDDHMFRYSEYFLKQSLISSIADPSKTESLSFAFTTHIIVPGKDQKSAWESMNAMTLKDLLQAGLLTIESVEEVATANV